MAQDRRDNGRNNDRRMERTAAAVKHIAEMDAKYGKDIKEMGYSLLAQGN